MWMRTPWIDPKRTRAQAPVQAADPGLLAADAHLDAVGDILGALAQALLLVGQPLAQQSQVLSDLLQCDLRVVGLDDVAGDALLQESAHQHPGAQVAQSHAALALGAAATLLQARLKLRSAVCALERLAQLAAPLARQLHDIGRTHRLVALSPGAQPGEQPEPRRLASERDPVAPVRSQLDDRLAPQIARPGLRIERLPDPLGGHRQIGKDQALPLARLGQVARGLGAQTLRLGQGLGGAVLAGLGQLPQQLGVGGLRSP